MLRSTRWPSTARPHGSLAHSYLFLRRAIGLIGVALPVVLIVGKVLLDGGGPLDSISDYYYSGMRNVFVGSMVATGVFLLSYRGYGLVDDVTSDAAGVGAIGVGLFPTTPFFGVPTRTDRLVGWAHLASAALFFAGLIVFCLFLFTRSIGPRTRRKVNRNAVYVASGLTMIVVLVLAGLVQAVFHAGVGPPHWVLWLESTAVEAFGVAWLVKGTTILADER
ncbi:MAG TPA: DUF998 domain-containing protein [Pseudonocardiaceae bacterium]|nr:DUF998 domain-containing protein [Pseudonocardiaceae bacterium]